MAAKKKNRRRAKASKPPKSASQPVRAPVTPAGGASATNEPKRLPPVAGIGASAGGLDAFKKLLAAMKTAEIAHRLCLSVKTVETYRDRIRQKLHIDDGTKLAHHATQWVLENG